MRLTSRFALPVLAVASLATSTLVLAPAAHAGDVPVPATDATFNTIDISRPGNAGVGIIPFTDALYPNCAASGSSSCIPVGRVNYPYQVGETEVSVSQWVRFLNTVDPTGANRLGLWSPFESSSAWPKYGQINRFMTASPGMRYQVSFPQWANKPYAFANFLRVARFVNSLNNGTVLARGSVQSRGRTLRTTHVRFSRVTETGMYDLRRHAPTRTRRHGFVLPSQNEWIKAAYYDPAGGGTYSYWKYPTNAGTFGAGQSDGPSSTTLLRWNGSVTNSNVQPLATALVNATAPPTWCPAQYIPAALCNVKNPLGLPKTQYQNAFKANVSTIGQAGTLSPNGTLDQGGNVVEWTDTITLPPNGKPSPRVWRRMHGGVANSTVYQLWISAVGLQPQDSVFLSQQYPWSGFRVGLI